jgi:hypothetical protein
MNNCVHIIDVKETGTKIVTYCKQCGTIFSVKESKEYNCRDTYLSSGTYVNKTPTQANFGVDLAEPPHIIKNTLEGMNNNENS